jgi:energy-coupling factor transporter ATP-binding protein EcfA2
VTNAEHQSRIAFLLQQFDLLTRQDAILESMSYSEIKRVMIIHGLLRNLPILAIDDFNLGLEGAITFRLLRYLRSLNKTLLIVLHQSSSKLMSLVDDVCLLADQGRCLFMGPCERALPVFLIRCPSDMSPSDFFTEQAANARPTNPVVRSSLVTKILDEELVKIRTRRASATRPILPKVKQYTLNDVQQISWLIRRAVTWTSIRHRTRMLLHCVVIILICGFIHYDVGRSLYTQQNIQDVSGLLIRILLLVTRFSSLMVLSIAPIDHDLVRRESIEQRLYSIFSYYIAKSLVDACIIGVLLISAITITVVFTGLDHLFALISVYFLAALCSTALTYLINASTRHREITFFLSLLLSQLLATFSGFAIHTRSVRSLCRYLQYLSFYYYSFNLLMLSQWKHVSSLSCEHKTWHNTSSHCAHHGNEVLYLFNIASTKENIDWLMLVGLMLTLHMLAYTVLHIKLKQ